MQRSIDPPPKKKGYPGTGGYRGQNSKIYWAIIFGPKMMVLQGVRHQKPYLGVCYANDPKKGEGVGYTTPVPALDPTTSLRGDFRKKILLLSFTTDHPFVPPRQPPRPPPVARSYDMPLLHPPFDCPLRSGDLLLAPLCHAFYPWACPMCGRSLLGEFSFCVPVGLLKSPRFMPQLCFLTTLPVV